MFKKWNRILAFLLSIALVTTTFGSDFASAKVYAEENEIVEESDETEEPKEETTISDLPAAEVIPQDELGGGNGEGSGNSENDEEGTTPVVTSTEGNGEGTPTPGDPVNTTDEPEYELDEDGNPVLDENGNPKLKEKVTEDETEEEVVETEEEVDGIKIYYVVSDEDAGSVSKKSEVFAENKELEGSTAEASDGYKFVNWTDEDGNKVCDDEYFIPTASDLGVSEDAEGEESEDGEEEVKEVTFTANFEEKVTWNQEFNQSKTIDEDGIIVSLYAEPNVLPDDAELRVTKITGSLEDDLENAVEADTDSTEELVATYSYDITIYSPSLGEVQPVDGKVSIQFSGIEEGKEDDTTISVYHAEEEDGEITGFDKIGFDDKKTSSIEVLSDSFSPYTVAITVKASNTQNTTFYAKIVDENYNEISGIAQYTVPALTGNGNTFSVADLKIGNVTDSNGNVYKFDTAKVYHNSSYGSMFSGYYNVTGFEVKSTGQGSNKKYHVEAKYSTGWDSYSKSVENQANTQLYFVFKKLDQVQVQVHTLDTDDRSVGTGTATLSFLKTDITYNVEDIAPSIEGYNFVKAIYGTQEYDLKNFLFYNGRLCVNAYYNNEDHYYYFDDGIIVKFYYEDVNAATKKSVEWYVGGEKVKTTKVAVGEMPSFGGTPERSSGNLNFDFEGWVTSADYGSSTTRYNNDSIPVVKETDETLKYYAVFSVRTYFYYLLPGKSYTSNSPSDYMHAGIGKVIVPDGISGRWYRDKHDLEKYVMDMPTDSAIRTGISTYYNGTHGRDKYQSDWTYSLTMQTLSFNNTAVGYDEKPIDNGNTLHMDCILTLDTTAKATITYVVNNYPDGNHKGSTISQPVMHVKNTSVEINSTVRSSGSFTTDTLKLNAEETVDGVRCKFDGWYTDETYTTKAPNKVTVTGTITYYARYVGKTYNITYVYNDGTDRTTSATATAGTQATVINDPTWVGHAFKGWTTSFDSNTYYQGNKFTMPSQNVTLTAQWESSNFKVKYQYTGTVPTGATKLPAEATVAYGTQNVAVAAGATAEGYTFSGWTTQDATVTGGRFTMPANEVVFTGSFTKNSYKVRYQYTGKVPEDATALPGEATVEYGTQNVAVAADATAEGYTFSGWTTQNATVTDGKFTMPANEVVFTGSFTKNSYKVRYQYTGDVPADATDLPDDASVEYGTQNVAVAADATAEGYTFSGWSTQDATVTGGRFTMPANEVVFTGSFTKNSYKVRYQYTGKVPEDATALPGEATVEYGTQNVAVAADATAEGYTFSGWTTQNATVTGGKFTMPANEVVFTGNFTINSYKVTYKFDGSEPDGVTAPADEMYNFKALVTTAKVADPIGYTFAGWKAESGYTPTPADAIVNEFNMPANQVDLVGSFKPRTDVKYTVEYYKRNLNSDEGYTIDDDATERKEDGTTGQPVTGYVKTFEGFTYEEGKEDFVSRKADGTETAVETGANVLADGSLVIKVYYSRKVYSVRYKYDGTVPADATALPETATYEYGDTVTIAADATAEGHTFSGWTASVDTEVVTTETIIDKVINVVKGWIGVEPDLKEAEQFTIDTNVVIRGHFDVNSYTVKYQYTGDVPADATALPTDATVAYGTQNVAVAAAATAEGYTFSGWTTQDATVTDGKFTMPANEVVFTGNFTINSYTVKYQYTGDVPADATALPTEATVVYGTKDVAVAAAATAEGYTFSGWTTQDATVTDGKFTMPANEVVFTGNFTINSYTVKYQYTGDVPADATALPTDATVVYGTKDVAVAAAATAEGYTFSGWTTQDATVTDGKFTMPANEVVFTGNFTINSYTVKYQYTGDVPADATALPTDATVVYGTKDVAVAAAATAEGYTFSGWTTQDATVTDGKFTMPANEVVFTGNFTINSYTVKYQYTGDVPADATALPTDATVVYGTKDVAVAAGATAEGYTFSGWTTQDATVTDGKFTMPANEVVFTGNFTINSYTVKYQYTGDVPADATALPTEATVAYGTQNVAVAAAATAEGYTFSGWTTQDATVTDGKFTMPANEVVFTGSFSINSYKVKYQYTGTVPEDATALPTDATVAYGTQNVAVAAGATAEGYTFSGWTTQDATVTDGKFTMPANEVVFTGSFSINSYKVKYQYTGTVPEDATELPAEATVVYGTQNVAVAAGATAEGYTFSGWTTENATVTDGKFTMPANEVVFTGSFSINSYKVKYQYTGTVPTGATELPAEATVVYGTQNVAVAAGATAEGYTFSGWTTENATVTDGKFTMPANEVVFTGSFTINSYKVKYQYTGTVPTDATELPAEATVVYGTQNVAVAEDATAEGYTFSGWTTQNATVTGGKFTMPANEVVFTGNFTINSYKVTYKFDGSEPDGVTAPADEMYNFKALVTTAKVADPIGYTFAGWKAESGYTPTPADAIVNEFNMPANQVDLVGSFKPRTDVKYTVEYYKRNLNSDEGYTIDEDATERKEDGTTGQPVTGYVKTFEGFTYEEGKEDFVSRKADGTETAVETGANVLADGSLVIKVYYSRKVYSVRYKYDGTVPADATALPETATYEYGDTVTIAADATAEGHTFSGWTASVDTEVVTTETIIDKVINVVKGWIGVEPDLKEAEQFTIDTNVVIRGHFDVNSYTVKYQYTGDVPADATALPTDATVAYGTQNVAVAAAATAEGYTFSGWTTQDATVTDGKFTMPANEVVFTGNFTINSYTVKYQYTGDVPADATALPTEATVVYGTKDVAVAAAATAEGYTFSGWTTQDATVTDGKFTMPANEVVFTGNFTINSYTVKYQYTGDVPADATALPTDATVVYGTKDVAVAAAATAEGYTFSGWTTQDATVTDGKFTMPANEVVFTGNFTINSYTVKYQYTGDVPADATALPTDATVVYGTKDVAVAAAATAEGYTFSGWTTQDATVTDGKFTMPANEVVFTGNFTIQLHNITYQWRNSSNEIREYKFTGVEHFTLSTPTADENFNMADKPEAPSTQYFVQWVDEKGTPVTPSSLANTQVTGDATYYASYEDKTIVNLQAVAETGSLKKVYDGTKLVADYIATVGNTKPGHTFDVKFSAQNEDGSWTDNLDAADVYQLNAGTKNFKIDGAHVDVVDADKNSVLEQYTITYGDPATLEVTKVQITIVASSDRKTYDATALTKASYYIDKGAFVGDELGLFKVYVKGSQTLPGESDNVITSCQFNGETAEFSDNVNTVSFQNYDITRQNGTLTVGRPESNMKMYLKIQATPEGANEKSEMYDGTYQSLPVKVALTSDVSEDEKTEGIVLPGYGDDGYADEAEPVEAKKEVKPSPVSALFTTLANLGVLTVYANEDELSDLPEVPTTSVVEDGNVKVLTETYHYGDTDYTVSGIKLTTEGGVDAGDYRVYLDTSEMKITLNGGNVTDLFDVEIVKPESSEEGDNVVGVLHVTKRDVVLSSESASQTYNGNALTRPNVTESGSGFVEGEVINVRATGSITNAGSVENTIVYEFNPENEQGLRYLDEETGKDLFENNYDLTLRPGTLTVNNPSSDDDNPGDPTTIPDAPVALAPSGAVLGAQRATGDGPAVLGARRAGTDDETNRMARVFAMVAAAAIAVTMMITGKKKDEEEEG